MVLEERRKSSIHCFEHQADATLSQANPVSGTKYTVLNTTRNVRIITIVTNCTWSGQPNPLEIHVTIDGILYTISRANPISTTNYNIYIEGSDAGWFSASDNNATQYGRAFLAEGRSVKIEVEITGGTVSNLSARVKYAIKK